MNWRLTRPYRARQAPSKDVAVVVPASFRTELTPEEHVSLRHLRHFLAPYDKFVLTPPGAGPRLDGLTNIEFDSKFFGSVEAHGRLLTRSALYRRFENYKFILIYHLDALVFRDDLLRWCAADFDYIGAPWLPCPEMPWVKEAAVGNGGFTLMKVRSMLEVLHNRHRMEPLTLWEDYSGGTLQIAQSALRWPRRIVPGWMRGRLTRGIRQNLKKIDVAVDRMDVTTRRNDLFWSREARRYLPSFRIPDWRTGLQFAFEVPPRTCFELNGRQLPFGCHAWARYDRDFWTPHLLPA